MMMREKRKKSNNGNKGPILALVLISVLFSTLLSEAMLLQTTTMLKRKYASGVITMTPLRWLSKITYCPIVNGKATEEVALSLLRLAIRAKRRLKTLLLQTLLPIALTNLK